MPLNDATRSEPTGSDSYFQNIRIDTATSRSLIDELEDAITKKNLRERATILRRVTDLFIVNGIGFSEEHIAMFDDVMSRLVAAVDESARAEFGHVIAKHPRAPSKTSRVLALDDEISVARPVLLHSSKLDDDTLQQGARTKSQDHLYAISLRDTISATVTDVLVERGDSKVVISTAANSGAEFSEFGHLSLAKRSQNDGELALKVWMRTDIPRHHLLTLFAAASQDLQKQLEAADPQKSHLYRSMVAQAKSQMHRTTREESANYTASHARVEALHRAGGLSEQCLLAFAQAEGFDEVTVALSLLGDLPVGHVERAMIHNEVDHVLVLARAIGLSWEVTRAILSMRLPQRNRRQTDPETYRGSFVKLQRQTALSAMQFYRLRARAEAQLETN